MKLNVAGFLTILLATSASAQEPDTAQLSRDERVMIADSIISVVENNFAHWVAVPQLDKDSLYRWYRTAAADAPDRLAFANASLQFTAALRNGHTTFDDMHQWVRFGGQWPFSASWRNGQWMIMRSLRNGIKPGDIITHVDGQPIEAYYRARRHYIAASSEREARHLFFGRRYLHPNRVTLTLNNTERVVVEKDKPDATLLGTLITSGYWIEPGRVAYIRIPSFGQGHFESRAIQYVRRFQNAETIIVDVRGNGGGSTPAHLTYSLIGPYRWFIIQIRDGTRGGPVQLPSAGDTLVPHLPRFQGKVALLVDGHCGSACDDFAMPFVAENKGRLFGETTVGSSGQPRGFNGWRGVHFRASSRRQYFPHDGSEFEGVGVKPHVEIVPRPADLRAGRDPVLAAAVAWARGS